MSGVTDEAIILRTYAYGETSRILRLLTARHGLRSAMARGALRPRSRFGGVLEPFAEGLATFQLRDNRDLQTLTAFELTRSPLPIGEDLLRFAGASLLADVLLRTGSEERQPGLFTAFRDALRRLASASGADLETIILAETWGLVARLGFGPALDSCLQCDRPLEDGEDARFDPAAGAVRCDRCGAGAPGRTLPAHARANLADLVAGRTPALEHTAAHWQLLRRHLEHHVVEGPLRTFLFLENALSHTR